MDILPLLSVMSVNPIGTNFWYACALVLISQLEFVNSFVLLTSGP